MELLNDALLFNPWISKADDTSEDIPEAEQIQARENLRKRREDWLNGRASKHHIVDNG